tara:strand:- start:1726 stop:2589 length:864 start_codon:yes stop_codon:yes gene_type:complete
MELVLGSAQFGLDYGISNDDGMTTLNEISKVLRYAQQIKIKKIDTAYSYGNSHKSLASTNLENFKIISKLPKLDGVKVDKDYALLIVKEILSDLNLNQIEGLLFHSSKDLLSKNGDFFYKLLINLKKEKLVKKIGVSVYDPKEIKILIKNFDLEIIQAPLNIFDRRIIHSEITKELRNRNIVVQVRSIFLQGLLLMNINSLPTYFDRWSEHMTKWDKFNKSNKLNAIESCINFIKDQNLIDEVIVGINNLKQLKEIYGYFMKKNKIHIDEELFNNDLGLIDPRNWEV